MMSYATVRGCRPTFSTSTVCGADSVPTAVGPKSTDAGCSLACTPSPMAFSRTTTSWLRCGGSWPSVKWSRTSVCSGPTKEGWYARAYVRVCPTPMPAELHGDLRRRRMDRSTSRLRARPGACRRCGRRASRPWSSPMLTAPRFSVGGSDGCTSDEVERLYARPDRDDDRVYVRSVDVDPQLALMQAGSLRDERRPTWISSPGIAVAFTSSNSRLCGIGRVPRNAEAGTSSGPEVALRVGDPSTRSWCWPWRGSGTSPTCARADSRRRSRTDRSRRVASSGTTTVGGMYCSGSSPRVDRNVDWNVSVRPLPPSMMRAAPAATRSASGSGCEPAPR